MKNLGALKQVDLREMWRKEEYDFTPWLMKDDNISLLVDREAPIIKYLEP